MVEIETGRDQPGSRTTRFVTTEDAVISRAAVISLAGLVGVVTVASRRLGPVGPSPWGAPAFVYVP
jgi:hypothetical protein